MGRPLIDVHVAREGAFAATAIASYTDLIAVDIMNTMLKRHYNEVMQLADVSSQGAKDDVEKWRRGHTQAYDLITARQQEVMERYGNVQLVIERTQFLEQQLAGRLSEQLADTFEFSKAVGY